MSAGAEKSWKTDLELVADIEEQTVLLLGPQIVDCSLDTGVSTVASKGQVGAVSPGGPEVV